MTIIILGVTLHAILAALAVWNVKRHIDWEVCEPTYPRWSPIYKYGIATGEIFLISIIPFFGPLFSILHLTVMNKRPPESKDKRVLELAEKEGNIKALKSTIDELKRISAHLNNNYDDVQKLYQDKCSEVVELKQYCDALEIQNQTLKDMYYKLTVK